MFLEASVDDIEESELPQPLSIDPLSKPKYPSSRHDNSNPPAPRDQQNSFSPTTHSPEIHSQENVMTDTDQADGTMVIDSSVGDQQLPERSSSTSDAHEEKKSKTALPPKFPGSLTQAGEIGN